MFLVHFSLTAFHPQYHFYCHLLIIFFLGFTKSFPEETMATKMWFLAMNLIAEIFLIHAYVIAQFFFVLCWKKKYSKSLTISIEITENSQWFSKNWYCFSRLIFFSLLMKFSNWQVFIRDYSDCQVPSNSKKILLFSFCINHFNFWFCDPDLYVSLYL